MHSCSHEGCSELSLYSYYDIHYCKDHYDQILKEALKTMDSTTNKQMHPLFHKSKNITISAFIDRCLYMDVAKRLGDLVIALNSNEDKLIEEITSLENQVCRLNDQVLESSKTTKNLFAEIEDKTRRIVFVMTHPWRNLFKYLKRTLRYYF